MDRWKDDLERVRAERTLSEQLRSRPPRNERDVAWLAGVRANFAEAQGLDAELKDAGVPFDVGELASVRARYPEAIPILVRHLRLPYASPILKSIIRALAVPYAGRDALLALDELLGQRRGDGDGDLLFVIGLAIGECAGKDNDSLLFDVVKDQANGNARSKPLLKLAEHGDFRAADLASEWLVRGELPPIAMRALYTLKAWNTRSFVEPYWDSEVSSWRVAARKFLRAADRAAND